MNHNAEFRRNRLLGLALAFERGELDKEFAAAEVSISDLRSTVAQRIRELADAIESTDR